MLEVFVSDLLCSVLSLNCLHIATKRVSESLCLSGKVGLQNYSPLLQQDVQHHCIANAMRMEPSGEQEWSKPACVQKRVLRAELLLFHHISAL